MWTVVDRIEGQRAILELEDGDIVEIDKKQLPPGAEPGSVLKITLSLDREQEEKLRKRWEELKGQKEGLT